MHSPIRSAVCFFRFDQFDFSVCTALSVHVAGIEKIPNFSANTAHGYKDVGDTAEKTRNRINIRLSIIYLMYNTLAFMWGWGWDGRVF